MSNQQDFFGEEPNFLYLPMHADNWAYFLSTGYIGGAYLENLSSDFQNNTGSLISGFKEFPPRWALDIGDVGTRVVVELDIDNTTLELNENFYVYDELLDITRAKQVYFATEDELNNFHASYNLFNDVPNNLIPSSVKSFPQEDEIDNKKLFQRVSNKNFQELREQKDLFGGWVIELLDCFEEQSENLILTHLLNPEIVSNTKKSVDNLILSILRAAQVEQHYVDEIIWKTTISTILEKKSDRGFDKLQLLKEIEDKLQENTDFKNEIENWISSCRKIITAEQELRGYKDEEGKLGRITALYAVIAHQAEDVKNLIINKSIGHKVSVLLRLVAGAFDGLSRSENKIKTDLKKIKILIDFSERIQKGIKTEIIKDDIFLSKNLEYQLQNYNYNGSTVFQKKISLPTYIQQLKFCAEKSNIKLYKEEDSDSIYLLNDNTKIFCELIKTKDKEVIDFYVLASNNQFINDKDYLLDILKLASQIGTPIGIRKISKEDTIIAFIHLLTDTLDQDEFEYTIAQLTKFPKEIDKLIKGKNYTLSKNPKLRKDQAEN